MCAPDYVDYAHTSKFADIRNFTDYPLPIEEDARRWNFRVFWPKCLFSQNLKNGRKHEIRQNLGKTAKIAKNVKFAVLTPFSKTRKSAKNENSSPFFGVGKTENAPKSVSFLNRGSVVPKLTVGKNLADPPNLVFGKVAISIGQILGESKGVPL